MLCPSCNKFAAYDTSAEPEIDSLDVTASTDEDGTVSADVSGSVRIVLTAECCGDDLKEATFDIDLVNIECTKHAECTCGDDWADNLEADADGPELTERQESTKAKTYKTGPKAGQTVQVPIPYRYQRRYFGCDSKITVTCACGKEVGFADFSDEIQASAMDELA